VKQTFARAMNLKLRPSFWPRMPRFYLHIRNGTGFVPDKEGIDVPAVTDARNRALAGARSLLISEICSGELDLRGRIEVADETNNVVLVVEFEEAVHILRGPLPPEPTAEDRA